MAFNINAHVILQGPKNISAVVKNIQTQLQGISVSVGVNIPKNAQQQIDALNKQLNNLNATNKKLTSGANSASSAVQRVGTSAKQAGNAMQVLGKETALTFKRFAAAGLVTATFFKLTQAISSAIPKALEFERGLNKLEQITGSTRRGLDGLAKTVDGLSRSFGKDANEILEVAQIFAQTGQSIRQVEASIRAVARSSLAPTFGAMKTTAEGLVAALNQFGIAASDSEKVLGSLNAVSKKFAVESDDLIAAIRRAGGVFAISAGQFKEPIDALNEFSAIFTAVRSTTRENAETIATGLRTIFSRLQRRGTIDVLKGLGIELTDTNGKFKGLFESFKILSKELDGLIQKGDTITLSAITEELGGIRQIGKLIPAIRNFNKAERAFAVASQGAVEGLGKDVAKGLEPLIVQFEKVRERFNSVIRTISNSSTFQALAKTAIGLANAFLTVAESLTPILPILAKLATFKLAKGASSFFQGFFGSVKGGGGAGGVGGNLGRVATGQRAKGGGGAVSSSFTASIKAMNTAVGALSKSTSINTTALGNLSKAIGTLTSAIRTMPRGAGAAGGFPRRRGRGGGGGLNFNSPRGYATGGLVPGTGNYDTVPAMLTPGEFVIRKSSVNSIGAGNLAGMNYAAGGKVTSGRNYYGTNPTNRSPINPSTKPSNSTRTTKRQRQQAVINRGLSTDEVLDELRFKDDKVKGVTLLNNPLAAAAIFMTPGRFPFPQRQTLNPASKGGGNIRKKLIAKRGLIRGGRSLTPTSAGGDLGPEDPVILNFGFRQASMDAVQSGDIKNALHTNVVSGIKQSVKAITGLTNLNQLGVNVNKATDLATNRIDLKSVEGHIFEAITSLATGSPLAKEEGAGFDFPNILPDSIKEFTKIFSPDLLGVKALEAKRTANRDSVSRLDNNSMLRKLVNVAVGESNIKGNTLGIRAVANKFAKGGAVGNVQHFRVGGKSRKKTAKKKTASKGVDYKKSDVNQPTLTANEIELMLAKMNNRPLPRGVRAAAVGNSGRKIGRAEIARLRGAQLEQLGLAPPAKRVKMAAGGAVGTDTVPAMLTPGEFVVSKQAAQGIGYGNLKSMNDGGKLAGYAAGGTVKGNRHFYGNSGGGGGGGGGGLGGFTAAAFIIPDLLFTIPMVTESFKQMNEGVEGSGAQLSSALLALAASALFAVPALQGVGLKGLKPKVLGGVLSKAGRDKFGPGAALAMSGGPGILPDTSLVPKRLRGLTGGLRAAGGGSISRGLGGTGLTAAAIGPAIAAAMAIAVTGPIVDSLTGVSKKLETIAPGVTGARGEGVAGARARGEAKGAIKGGIGAATVGFILGGPIGAGIGALIGSVGGSFIGGLNAEIQAVKFENLIALSDASKVASEALEKLGKDGAISAEDISKANRDVAGMLNALNTGASATNVAEQGSVGGIVANALIGEDDANILAGSENKFVAIVNSIFGKGMNEAEEEGARAAAKLRKVGVGYALAIQSFDPEIAKKSTEAVRNTFASLSESLISGSANAEQAFETIGNVIASLEATDSRGIQKGFFDLQKTLRSGDFGAAGREAADTVANDFSIQLIAGLKPKLAGLSLTAQQTIGGALAELSDPEVAKDPEKFNAALDKVRQSFASAGQGGIALNAIFNSTQKEAIKTAASTAAAGLVQGEYANMLNKVRKQTEAIVSSIAKLTNVFEQAAGSFDTIIANTGAAIDSLLSGNARFELDETPNPFENLDLTAGSADFKARIEQGFAEINAVGGPGAAAVTSGLEQAPEFAANFDQFLRDTLNNIKSFEDSEIGGQAVTQGQVTTKFEEALAAADPSGALAKSDLGKLILSDIEAALFGATGSRQGGTKLSTDTLRKALIEDADLLEKFGENVKEIVGELAKQRDLAAEIKAQDLRILAEKRKVQLGLRDLAQKNVDIKNRVGEITGSRTGSAAEADADLRARIGLITGGDSDTNSLIKSQTILGNKLAAERAKPAAQQDVIAIGTLEAQLADNTTALKTLADDTSRLTAVQSEIEKLQSREADARIGALDIFGKFAAAQKALRAGDPEGAAKIFREIRADFITVKKLQTGAALNFEQASQFLRGDLNGLLGLLGASPQQIEDGIDKGFKQVPGALQGALAGIGVNIDAAVFAQNLNMDSAIEPLKLLAAKIGAEQQKANDAIMKEITTRANQLFDSLTESQRKLKIELGEATLAVAKFKAGLLEDVEGEEPIFLTEGLGGSRETALAGLSGFMNERIVDGATGQRQLAFSSDEDKTFQNLQTGEGLRARLAAEKVKPADEQDDKLIARLESQISGMKFGFSTQQIERLKEEIEKLRSLGIEISIDDIFKARQKLIRDAGFDPNDNASIRRLRQSRSGGVPAGDDPTRRDGNSPNYRRPPRNYGGRLGGVQQQMGFYEGGVVPGQGNTDSVEAMLTPGEFVMTKQATKAIGAARLSSANKRKGFNTGGLVGGSAGVQAPLSFSPIELSGKAERELSLLRKTIVQNLQGFSLGSIGKASKSDDMKETNNLLKDSLSLLFIIAENTFVTAAILKAEQGPNSFSVYDKTGDKNASEATKKLTDIEKVGDSRGFGIGGGAFSPVRPNGVPSGAAQESQFKRNPADKILAEREKAKSAADTSKKLTDTKKAIPAKVSPVVDVPTMMRETIVEGIPDSSTAASPSDRPGEKQRIKAKDFNKGLKAPEKGLEEDIGPYGFQPIRNTLRARKLNKSRGTTAGDLRREGRKDDSGGTDKAWEKYNKAMDTYEAGGFQGDAPRAPNDKSSAASSGASGTFFVSTEMNEMRSPPSRSAFDSDKAGTTKKDPPKKGPMDADVAGIPQPTGFSSEYPKFRTGASSLKEPRFRPGNMSQIESKVPGMMNPDEPYSDYSAELDRRANAEAINNRLSAENRKKTDSVMRIGESGPSSAGPNAGPPATPYQDARNRIREENKTPEKDFAKAYLGGKNAKESDIAAKAFKDAVDGMYKDLLESEGKEATPAAIRSRLMSDLTPEQRVTKVGNEQLAANMIKEGAGKGQSDMSTRQTRLDAIDSDPDLTKEDKLAARIRFLESQDTIGEKDVGMSMKEKTDRLEGRVTGVDKLTGRANVLQGKDDGGQELFQSRMGGGDPSDVVFLGGGEQAKRDAASENRMKDVKLEGAGTYGPKRAGWFNSTRRTSDGASSMLDSFIPGLGKTVQEGRTNFGRSGAITTTGLAQGTGRATTRNDVNRDLQDLKTDRKYGRGPTDEDLTFDVLGLGGKDKTSLDFGQKEKDLKLLQANSRERNKRQDKLFDEFQKQGAGKEENRVRGFGGSLSPQMSQEEYNKKFAEIEGSSFLGNKFMTAEETAASAAKNLAPMQEKGATRAALDKEDTDRSAATTARVQMSTKEKAAEYLRSQSSFNLPDVTAENITDEQVSSAIRQKQQEAKNKVLQDAKDKFKNKPSPAPGTKYKSAADRGAEQRAKIKADLAEKNRPDRLYDDKARTALEDQFKESGIKPDEAKEKAQKEVDKRRLKQEALDQLNPAARRSYEQGRSKLPIDENVETKVKELEEKRAEKRAADQAAEEARQAQKKADKKAKKKAKNQPSWRNLWGMAGGGGGGGAQPTSLFDGLDPNDDDLAQPAGGDAVDWGQHTQHAQAQATTTQSPANQGGGAGGKPAGVSDEQWAIASDLRKPGAGGGAMPMGGPPRTSGWDTSGGLPPAPEETEEGRPIYPTRTPKPEYQGPTRTTPPPGMTLTGGPAGGAPGAGGGIMGPDAKAIAAMNNLATALNGVSGGIEIKITEPVEVKLDSGSLIPKIKEIVEKAVGNAAANAAVTTNNSQLDPMTASSQNV